MNGRAVMRVALHAQLRQSEGDRTRLGLVAGGSLMMHGLEQKWR